MSGMASTRTADRFTGRCALITGGARGQGAAHAERLAQEGAAVVIADVLGADGEETAERLRAAGLDVTYAHLDVASPDSWEKVRAELATRWGRLDVLVNNAGILTVSPIGEHTLAAWERTMAVNLTGAFLGMTAMLPLLRVSRTAAIVNTSSVFGPSGAHGYAAYAASKAGLLGLTRTAALELADAGIRVNALVPGGVTTAINADEGEGVVPETPLGRRARADELAAAVAYLASEDASFVTGTELVVDGGFRAR